jgi:hypothetical protein
VLEHLGDLAVPGNPEAYPATDDWYLDSVLSTWRDENSSLLTPAIGFGMSKYVQGHLVAEVVRSKTGRPILGHVLLPRLGTFHDEFNCATLA